MTRRPRAHPGTPFDVVIEIPRGSRNKYEYDHEQHVIRLDRRLFSATVYPADYGFVPDTLAARRRPARRARAARGPDVPRLLGGGARRRRVLDGGREGPRRQDPLRARRTTPSTTRSHDLADLPQRLLDEIEHFFDVYKMLEPEKNSTTRGYEGRDAAYAEIEASRLRFQSSA